MKGGRGRGEKGKRKGEGRERKQTFDEIFFWKVTLTFFVMGVIFIEVIGVRIKNFQSDHYLKYYHSLYYHHHHHHYLQFNFLLLQRCCLNVKIILLIFLCRNFKCSRLCLKSLRNFRKWFFYLSRVCLRKRDLFG